MLPPIELSIIKGLIHDETYTRRVLPYVKDVYFEAPASHTYFDICQEYFSKYNSCPTKESLQVYISDLEGISEEQFQSIGETFEEVVHLEEKINTDWLVDATEKWCKERAVYLLSLIHI